MKLIHYWPHLLFRETGPGNAIYGWCRALQRLGVNVEVAVDEDAARLDPPPDIPCRLLPHGGRGRLRYPIGWPDGGVDADLIITHGGWELHNIAAARAARRNSLPYVVTTHGVYHPRVLGRRALVKRVWHLMLEKKYLNRALAVHVYFEDERAHLRDLGVHAPLLVVPNGIAPPTNLAWDGGSGGFVLWLGRYDPENKGLDLLIEAIGSLPETDRPHVHLHGPDWKGGKLSTQEMVERAGLGAWIDVGEPIYGEEKWAAMASAVAFVYPSRWEASPTAVVEAMSLGTPTVVAAYPLGRFVAERGGAVLSGWSGSELAAALIKVTSDEGPAIGTRGAEVAAGELSWDAVAPAWLEQTDALLGGVGKRSS